MRIIGGHDYYDGALAHGRDEDLVFLRGKFDTAPTVLHAQTPLRRPPSGFYLVADNRGWSSAISEHHIPRDRNITLRSVVVILAGKRHGGLHVRERWPWSTRQDVEQTFWSEDEAVAYLASIGLTLPGKRHGSSVSYNAYGTIPELFDTTVKPEEETWLIENRKAIAIWHHPLGSWDRAGWKFDTDGLRDIGFAKVVDPYTAFQELSMYVGGVLPRDGNPIVTITDDKVLAGKHGFDKWSFRKMPGT